MSKKKKQTFQLVIDGQNVIEPERFISGAETDFLVSEIAAGARTVATHDFISGSEAAEIVQHHVAPKKRKKTKGRAQSLAQLRRRADIDQNKPREYILRIFSKPQSSNTKKRIKKRVRWQKLRGKEKKRKHALRKNGK